MKFKTHDADVIAPLVRIATGGDTEAIHALKAYYLPYIRALSTEKIRNDRENADYAINITTYQRLEIDFIKAVLQFIP